MRKEQIHTIELVYHQKNRVTVFNDDYEPEQMTRIINDLQRLCWTLGDYESDEDLIPWIVIDGSEIPCEQEDITQADLEGIINKINGVDDE